MDTSNDISIKTKFVSLEDFLEALSPALGAGSEGSCYLYRGKVIKVLDGPAYCKEISVDEIFDFDYDFSEYICPLEVDDSLMPTEEYIMRYSHIKNDAFAFANGVFRVDDKIRGVVMPYIDIPKLSRFQLSSVKYDALIRACKKCTKDISQISKLGIEIFDIDSTNIHFDGKQFKFCDTLNWIDHDYDSSDKVFKQNSSYMSRYFIEYFTRGNIRKSLTLNKEISEMYNERKFLECPSIFFSELKNHLSNVCEESINSIAKADKILSKKIFKSN